MTNSSADLVLVHGFLGLPTDWNAVVMHWREHFNGEIHLINLWEVSDGASTLDSLALHIEKHVTNTSVVVGYSLGGRILLHLSAAAVARAKALILISSHFGLESDQEKVERLQVDNRWAERFMSDMWEDIMADWEAQPVFANDSSRILRLEKNYSRQHLADVVVGCSLGIQSAKLMERTLPVNKLLFLYGSDDPKYSVFVKKWKTQRPQLQTQSVPGGHFPLVNSAHAITQTISTFYRNLMKS